MGGSVALQGRRRATLSCGETGQESLCSQRTAQIGSVGRRAVIVLVLVLVYGAGVQSLLHRAIALNIMHFRREAILRINQDLVEVGSSAPMYMMLFRLSSDGASVPQGELASDAGLDASAVSRMIGRLAEEELVSVRVNPADRRQRLISLTKSGERRERALAKIVDTIISEMMSPLTKNEQKTFLDLLKRTTENL